MRTAPAGLHGQAIVAPNVQKLECGHGGILEIKLRALCLVVGLQGAGLRIPQHSGPAQFSLAYQHGIAVFFGLRRERGGVNAADHHLFARLPQFVCQGIGLSDLGAVARNGDKIAGVELLAYAILRGEPVHLYVGHMVSARGHAGQGEETKTGQRGNHLAPLDKARQGQAHVEQLLIAHTDAAHGNQRNLHIPVHWLKKSRVPMTRLSTGMKKKWRNASLYAARKQSSGMVTAPTTKRQEAYGELGAT